MQKRAAERGDGKAEKLPKADRSFHDTPRNFSGNSVCGMIGKYTEKGKLSQPIH